MIAMLVEESVRTPRRALARIKCGLNDFLGCRGRELTGGDRIGYFGWWWAGQGGDAGTATLTDRELH